MSTTTFPQTMQSQIRLGNSYYLPSPLISAGAAPAAASDTPTRFVLVTGGVCSSLGKGVTTSSIGALLRAQGLRVCSIKIDPYINVDAGLMSPYEHGEVYVLNDGGEVDLDLGNYERWLSVRLTRDHNITTGKVYQTLITRERAGKYLGKTVQLVPHFTNEVVEHILRVSRIPVDESGKPPQVCMIELGGTVGDLESAPFIEALRTLRFTRSPEQFCLVHCTYLPVMGGGQKTKPTQHSCRTLLSLGLTADLLVCRSEAPLQADAKAKLSQQCGIQEKDIFSAYNVKSLYEVPVEFSRQGLVDRLLRKLRLQDAPSLPSLSVPSVATFSEFSAILRDVSNPLVRIAFVGKYVGGGSDAYFSVMQTFEHCCLALRVRVEIVYVDAELLEGDAKEEAFATLRACDGIYCAGGFGNRGVNGKIAAARLARTENRPYFGVCLGMQLALVEYARSQLGWVDANSEEFDAKASKHILRIMEGDRTAMGATMHLGAREVHIIDPSSRMARIYGGASTVVERHRHRYEFNMEHFAALRDAGVHFTAVTDPALGPTCRVEAIELPSHRFFLAVQYHPEFCTTPVDPSPPYLAFVAAAAGRDVAFPAHNSRRASSVQRAPSEPAAAAAAAQ